MTDRQSRFEYEELLACGRGELFGPGNAQLPLPPMRQVTPSSSGVHRKPPEPISEKPDDTAKPRVWMFAGGGLAALLLIGAFIAFLMRLISVSCEPI